MSGDLGKKLNFQMMDRFERIQEPGQLPQKKPMVIFDEKPKPRRGGKKYRKMKERLGLTQTRQLQNRILMDPNNVAAVLLRPKWKMR